MKVFLSYPIQDELFAEKIEERLSDVGFDVWFFQKNFSTSDTLSRSEQIFAGIAKADVQVVLITESTIHSKGVNQEVLFAKSLKMPILAVQIHKPVEIPYILLDSTILDVSQYKVRMMALEIKDVLIKIATSSKSTSPKDFLPPEPKEAEISDEKVFIAYSRNQKELAKELSEFLIGEGKQHFWDDNILAGAAWRQTIQKALDDCTHLIVIWTKDAAKSDEVEREVSYALAERKVIIPILSKDIPKLPYHLHGFQYVILKNNLKEVTSDILRAIENTSQDDIWQ